MGINEIFYYVLVLNEKTKIPRILLDKKIMLECLLLRLKHFMRVSVQWLRGLTNNFASPPELNWAKFGVYRLRQTDHGIQIDHCDGCQDRPINGVVFRGCRTKRRDI